MNQQEESADPEDRPWHDGLTDRQRRFCEEYAVDWNATQAAIRAGYSEHTAQEQGSRLLSNVMVRAAIDAYLDELSMSAAEALHKLTSWGRGTLAPFITPTGHLDLASEGAQHNLHLIKKVKVTRRVERTGNDNPKPDADIITTEIELHDPKDAVKTILEVRGKLVQRLANADGSNLGLGFYALLKESSIQPDDNTQR